MKLTRVFVLLGAAVWTAVCVAQQPAAKPGTAFVVRKQANHAQPRTMPPDVRSNLLARTGGIIPAPKGGPVLLFLNAQQRVPEAAFGPAVSQIEKVLRLPCALRAKASGEPVAEAVQALADTNVAAVVVIGDSAGYPSMLLAPDSRWGVVNVAALGGAGVAPERLAERTQKEVLRAFGLLMGTAFSSQEGCVLKPVLKPEDLDGVAAKFLGVESLNKILAYAQRLGVKPARLTTYRKAVEEGWAPAPTNDAQRAIWQELKK